MNAEGPAVEALAAISCNLPRSAGLGPRRGHRNDAQHDHGHSGNCLPCEALVQEYDAEQDGKAGSQIAPACRSERTKRSDKAEVDDHRKSGANDRESEHRKDLAPGWRQRPWPVDDDRRGQDQG